MAKKLSTEMKIKKFLTRVIYSGKSPIFISKADKHIVLTDNSRILFLRQDRIGDVIVSIPTFKLIINKYPHLKMDVLLGEKNISTQRALTKYFNKIYFYKKDFFSIIKLISNLLYMMYALSIDGTKRMIQHVRDYAKRALQV